jgi:hypothetical protein
MQSVVRQYETEDKAREALARLTEYEYAADEMFMIGPSGDADSALREAIAHERIPGGYYKTCAAALEKGNYLVVALPPFGSAEHATTILESCDPVNVDAYPELSTANPSPLSDFLGIPTLSHHPTFNIRQTTREGWSFSRMIGMGMLSKRRESYSPIIPMPLLSANKSKTSSFGLPLLTKRRESYSPIIPMPLLSSRKSKDSSFGFPTLSSNPAPLSNLFYIPLLSKRD